MNEKTQIGLFHLKEDKEFTNTFEFAAWYEKVLVPAGTYPMNVYGLKFNDRTEGREVDGHIGGGYIDMEGTIVSDYFAAHYFGVPVSDYDEFKNAGKPSNYAYFAYMYEIADSILNDPDTPYELFPQYEAREIHFEYDGEQHTTHGIFVRENEVVANG